MKKLVIFLTFTIGALMMLDSAQACKYKEAGYVYIIQEGLPTLHNKILYKVGGTKKEEFQERLTNLQTGNPRKLTVMKSYLVTDCKSGENVAHAAVQEKYPCPFGGGTEWFMVPNDAAHEQDFYVSIDTKLAAKEHLVAESYNGLPQQQHVAARKVQLARRQGDKSRRFIKFITSLLD